MINKTKHISQATPVDTLTHLQATVTMEDLLTILTADILAALDTPSTMAILDIMAILATLLTPLDTILHIMDTMEEEDIHTLLKTNNRHHLAQVSLKSKLLRLIKLIMRRPLRNI